MTEARKLPGLDLDDLLASIDPRLNPGVYVFCEGVPEGLTSGPTVRMLFRESEATTVVMPLADAQAGGLAYSFPCEWITLGANSDLAAIGFLAVVTARLAEEGISANVVSATRHDHLFVPAGRGSDAMTVLQGLQGQHHDGRPIGSAPVG